MTLFAAVAALLGVSCSNAEQARSPVLARLGWFAMLEGRDIRESCTPDSPPRYRFVYNAAFDEQARIYDIVRTADGATFRADVTNADTTLVEFRSGAQNPFMPKRHSEAVLDRNAYLDIVRAVEADGFGAPTRTDVSFPSWDFYWIVTACAGGKFHINGWRNDNSAFAALRFPALLFAHDKTEVAVRSPRPNAYADYVDSLRNNSPNRNFDVRLTPTGIVGGGGVF
jgi:hypothetical protein